MRFRSLHKWGNLAETTGLLFFAQRAEELLFSYSLDTFKPLALNAPYLSEEAISVTKDAYTGIFNETNCKHVIEELRWSLSKDPVAKSLLDLPIDSYLPIISEKTKFSDEIQKLEILGRTLDPKRYLSRCIELLKEALISNRKKDIDILARLYFTTLINIGYHKSHLYHTTIAFFFNESGTERIEDISAFDRYVEKFPCQLHNYIFLFSASNLIEEVADSIKAFKLETLETIPSEFQQIATDEFVRTEESSLVKVADIKAFDRHTARERAELKMEQVRDLFTLYHHKEQISWQSDAIAKQCCEDEPFIIGLPSSTMQTAQDLKPPEASRHLNNLIKTLSLQKPDFRKFIRAADFHGLAVKNPDPENQLLSLWIALETIVPSQPSAAKINNIVSSIVPFLTMNYLGKIFRVLARDLIRWDRIISNKIIKKVPTPPGTSLVKKLFLLTVVKDHEELRRELYTALKDFHLLRYRIFSLSDNLSNPTKIAEVLKNHESKVSWQIRRLYRTRNLIIHSGRTPHNINTLIENGHAYLDEILISIVQMSASSYHISKITQAFDLAEIAKKKIFHYCKSNAQHSPELTGILIGEHEFIRRTVEP